MRASPTQRLITLLSVLALCTPVPGCSDNDATAPGADADADADAGQGTDCSKDSDCVLGQICERGDCVDGCASSRDCPSGLRCDKDLGEHGSCVSCVADTDCDGLTCVDGTCVSACVEDGDCPPGRPLCDTREPPSLCVACLSVDDCPLLTLCFGGACEEGCRSVRDCPGGWFCDPDSGDHGQCQLDVDPEPERAPELDPEPDADIADADADPVVDLIEREEQAPEPDNPVDRVDDPPMQCDEAYNLGRGRGSLEADVNGRGADNRYRSTDVLFSWRDTGADRPFLTIDAKEWCRYGTLKADLLISCLIRKEDLSSLPLEINLTSVFISGKNSCKAAYSDRRAVFHPKYGGSIVFEGYTERNAISGRFSAEVVEATDPSNVLIFGNGSFAGISAE